MIKILRKRMVLRRSWNNGDKDNGRSFESVNNKMDLEILEDIEST